MFLIPASPLPVIPDIGHRESLSIPHSLSFICTLFNVLGSMDEVQRCYLKPKYMITEADTCRKYVLPTMEAGWDNDPHSLGGAGRNRTLGLEKFEAIDLPIPSYSKQLWFDKLLSKVGEIRKIQSQISAKLHALLPSILDKAFKGEL